VHKSRCCSGSFAGAVLIGFLAVLSLSAVPALAAPTVTVRIEGESGTLLPQTKVTLDQPDPLSACAGNPANSVASAINLAVDGNWDHGKGEGFTETILGETHAFTHESDTWAEWVNYKWGGGICADLLSEGDEVLMVADHEPEPFFAPTVLPLVFSQPPATVQTGVPFTLAVSAIHTAAGAFAEPGEGEPQPMAGATVSGGGVSGLTDANGTVTLTLANAGETTLFAKKSGDAPSAPLTICVHNANDGTCGTPGATAAGASGAVAGIKEALAGPYKGAYALVADVKGLIDGHVYPRRDAPRVLNGTVLAHSAVSSVSLELRRQYRGRCYAYEGTRERFLRAGCGHGSLFKVSSNGVFSYLLPSALAPGRYVLDVQATDLAGNSTTLARGTSRLVFYVR
jgi:hypothetical protein